MYNNITFIVHICIHVNYLKVLVFSVIDYIKSELLRQLVVLLHVQWHYGTMSCLKSHIAKIRRHLIS